MTFKSIALAAAMFALPLALTDSIAGGSALAVTVGSGGGGGSGGGSAGGGAVGSEGGGNVEPGMTPAFCIPANTNSLDAAQLQAKYGCPKTVTLRIGSLRLN